MGHHEEHFREYEPMGAEEGGTGRRRSGEPERGARGERAGSGWQGYVMPYRYYGPGYQGVGYYSVMYQGPGDERDAGRDRSSEEGERMSDRARDWSEGVEGGYGRGAGWQDRLQGQGMGTGGTGDRFRGRGPRGYRRSDERVREEVSDRLMEHGDIDASEIDVEVRDGEVTLSGSVPDRWTKRAAEDVAERCTGVRDVMNQLRVATGDAQQAQRGTDSGRAPAEATSGTRASTRGERAGNGRRERESAASR